jgi:hypothetical protein
MRSVRSVAGLEERVGTRGDPMGPADRCRAAASPPQRQHWAPGARPWARAASRIFQALTDAAVDA